MFIHRHPYPPFIPENATKLIVGTLPPPRFSGAALYREDVDFCYGSKHGLLWPILDAIYNLKLSYQDNKIAVEERKEFLVKFGIGICDIVHSCEREKIDASDLGMNNIIKRDLIKYLESFKNINTILFMGGNSKNGPEYLFRKYLASFELKLESVTDTNPKINQFTIKDRKIKTISLISPSNAANRSIGSNPIYKEEKLKNKEFTTLQFRIDQYRKYFI
jgi:G:T/U-mismatch repair DNA glycosylase